MAELRISGAGSLSAGGEYYDYVGISGSGVISGDLNCKTVKISGSGKIDGNISCDGDIHISGSGKLLGDVKAVSIHVSGSSKFEKNIKCSELKISGSGTVVGDVECENLKASGGVNLSNVSASEEAVISGSAKISGLLNAESVLISLGGNCNINEIGCTNLTVKRSAGSNAEVKIFNFTLLSINNGGGKGSLVAKTIEGDDIDIEYTTAETVRGAKVVIGKGCRIGRVEYSETLEVDGSAEVGERVKI